MRTAAGWALFVFGVPLGIGLFLVLGLASFLLVPAALLLLRPRAGMREATPVALVVWAALVVLALLGGGITLGTQAGPLLSEGGSGTEFGGLVSAWFLVYLTPGAVALAFTDHGWARRFAWGSVAAALLGIASWPSVNVHANGLPVLALGLAYLLFLAGLAVLAWRPRAPPIAFGMGPPVGSRGGAP